MQAFKGEGFFRKSDKESEDVLKISEKSLKKFSKTVDKRKEKW